ncbi:hypothetical protein H5410_041633 [Solanum commersonii]|uniref:DUF4283 domain-containing protein n=1 Tax=Solanum commersonii TaxID=4109 RepID=A0A9J5XU51_SOLCO|nr:hypothetical protein H5410_041633 [Solanum commersonii]
MRGMVEILDKIGAHEGDLLSRCLVGFCSEKPAERPTLADLKRLSSSNWKNVFSINIYELNDKKFLFEFPYRNMAEQTIQGQWRWKTCNLHLEWWTPTTTSISKSVSVKETWIRAVGIPLHLWSNKVFQEKGEICGGWVAMEEETKLKNHMKWARILVANNGPDVAAQVIVNNFQGEIEGLLTAQRSFECVEEIRAQRVVHGNSQVTENSPTFARMVRKSAEIMKDKETSMEIEDTNKQVESNQEPSEIDHDNNRVVLQNPITEIVNREIDEAKPIMSQQQFIMQGKEKETSNWVQQNLIKSGKIFGVDFQGHEEEAIELLLQIDSCRLARRQEQCSESQRLREYKKKFDMLLCQVQKLREQRKWEECKY